MVAGYSNKSLSDKLGIKNGFTIKIIHPPSHYFELLKDMPITIFISDDPNVLKDFIHLFITEAHNLNETLRNLKSEIKSNGMIWVSWPKKASKVPTDITEDVIRSIALKIGLVDIKVCAVDEIWSALKLVIPVKDRKS
jgi:hypothetical protein